MIPLERDRARIDTAFLDPTRHTNLVELFREARDGRLKIKEVKDKIFASSRWSRAKDQLRRETHGKCAFCEAPTDAVYYGDVEHIRPKAAYWWLAYCYDNWLYSCRVCNGKKGDRHDIRGMAIGAPPLSPGMDEQALLALALQASPDPRDAAAVAALRSAMLGEASCLPDPYLVDPTRLFVWTADATLREVRIAPRPGVAEAADAFDAAERIVNLNRPELLIARWKTYENVELMCGFVAEAPQPLADKIRDAVRLLAQPDAPFSAMTTYFAREEWGVI